MLHGAYFCPCISECTVQSYMYEICIYVDKCVYLLIHRKKDNLVCIKIEPLLDCGGSLKEVKQPSTS